MKESDREDNGTLMSRRKLLQTAGMTGAAMIAGYGMSSLLTPTPASASTLGNRNFVIATTSADAQDVINNSQDNLYLDNVALSSTINITRSIVIIGGPTGIKPVVDLPALTPCLKVTAPSDAAVTLISVRVNGDKANQSSPGGSQDGGKHGLYIASKCSIYALDCDFSNNITDGMYYNASVTSAQDNWKLFENCSFIGNGRQGTSIINGDKLHFKNCRFNNTSGLLPMAGVDIEPNSATEYVGTIIFEDCEMNGNAGHGLEVNSASTSTQMDIRLIRHTSLGNTVSDKMSIYFTGNCTYKSFSVDGLRTDGGIMSNTGRCSFGQVSVNNAQFELASNKITMGNAQKFILSNISWAINPVGYTPWTLTNIGELHIEKCELPSGNHTATEGNSGTAITLSGVKTTFIEKCTTWRTGYRLLVSTQTDGGRGTVKIRDCHFQQGDSNNFRLAEITDCDVTLSGNTIAPHSDSELYMRGTSLGWVLDNRFDATSPTLKLAGTAAYKRVKGNVNLADI